MLNRKIVKFIKDWSLLILGLLIFIIILRKISIQNFTEILSRMNITFLIISFLLGYCSTIFRTLRYYNFFPAPGRIINLYGTFAYLRMVYYALPFNSGEIAYLSVLKKYKFSPSIAETAPTWMFLRLKDIIALAIWTLFALILLGSGSNLFVKFQNFHLIIIGSLLAATAGLFFLPKIVLKFSALIPGKWFSERLAVFREGFNRTSGGKKIYVTLILSIFIWAATIYSTVFAQMSLNTPLNFSDLVMCTTMYLCVTLLPINAPLGIGTGDAAWIGILILAGVNSSIAISLALAIRLLSILLVVSEGFIGYCLLLYFKSKPLPAVYESNVKINTL